MDPTTHPSASLGCWQDAMPKEPALSGASHWDDGRACCVKLCPCLSQEKRLKDDSAAAASPLCLGLSGGELPNQFTGGVVRLCNGHGFLRLHPVLSHAPVHTCADTQLWLQNHLCTTCLAHHLALYFLLGYFFPSWPFSNHRPLKAKVATWLVGPLPATAHHTPDLAVRGWALHHQLLALWLYSQGQQNQCSPRGGHWP